MGIVYTSYSGKVYMSSVYTEYILPKNSTTCIVYVNLGKPIRCVLYFFKLIFVVFLRTLHILFI